MKAIVVTDQAAGTAGMKLVERPKPHGTALAGLSGDQIAKFVIEKGGLAKESDTLIK